MRYIYLMSVYDQMHIFYAMHGAMCFQLTISHCFIIERIRILSYHHRNRNMNHRPFFRVRSWSNVTHCMSCYVPIDTFVLVDWDSIHYTQIEAINIDTHCARSGYIYCSISCIYVHLDTSLKDVVIGVTDVANDPTSHENPTTSQFTECGRINRVVGSAEMVVVTCPEGGVIGRHLVVMIDRSSPIILTVCEITAEGCELTAKKMHVTVGATVWLTYMYW